MRLKKSINPLIHRSLATKKITSPLMHESLTTKTYTTPLMNGSLKTTKKHHSFDAWVANNKEQCVKFRPNLRLK